MVRVITALVATLAAVVTLGATSTTAAAPGESSGTVAVARDGHWCC
jgi:hypothetical protein